MSEKSKGMYARRLSIYRNHSFHAPDTKTAKVFQESAPTIVSADAYRQSDNYWKMVRPVEAVRKNPNSVSNLMAKLRSVPVFYFTEKVISVLVSGYIPTNKEPSKNKFDLGPMNLMGIQLREHVSEWVEEQLRYLVKDGLGMAI